MIASNFESFVVTTYTLIERRFPGMDCVKFKKGFDVSLTFVRGISSRTEGRKNEKFSEERETQVKPLLSGNDYAGTIYTEWVGGGRRYAKLVG